jgi:ADP-ribosylglycohydrolase
MTRKPPAPTTLSRLRFEDQVLGCWTGKNVGGTLGLPHEGTPHALEVTGYETPEGEPMPNDDLDLQLVWLRAMQERGPGRVNAAVLAEYWLTYVPPHWNEYGVSKANSRIGLAPPLTGSHRNEHWKNSNGAWIRSEIWACLAPAAPDLAARWAYEDACVDHGDGEGTWAAMFTAALQSTAFVTPDVRQCIRAGLARVPASSLLARGVTTAMAAFDAGVDWREARERVIAATAPLGFFQAPANVGYVVIGLLYGDGDFGASLLHAVNCGDDTDCTGATTGATLGILQGRSALPSSWTSYIGDRILTLAIERGNFHPPKTVQELSDAVVELTPAVLLQGGAAVRLDPALDVHDAPEATDEASPQVQQLWEAAPGTVRVDAVHTLLEIDHLDVPVLASGESTRLRLRAVNQVTEHADLRVEWLLPDGWAATPGPEVRLSVQSLNTSPHAVEAVLGSPPAVWPPRTEVDVDVTAGRFENGVARAVVRVTAAGRPTVGQLPLTIVERTV